MNNQPFDLNDSENERSDEQLHSWMSKAAIEARKKDDVARKQLMDILPKEISRVNQIEGL
ncbi:MAG: hypothetical protein PHO08_09990 [Methylococcales bacterium]|nr:hypothetical protein [Methylococcales bacterium]MDD5630717.1 hypothetical protein [Methylococcales bacterium]